MLDWILATAVIIGVWLLFAVVMLQSYRIRQLQRQLARADAELAECHAIIQAHLVAVAARAEDRR